MQGIFGRPYSLIVEGEIVLKRTVCGDWRFENLSGSHISESRLASAQVAEMSVSTTWAEVIFLSQDWLPLRLPKCLSQPAVSFHNHSQPDDQTWLPNLHYKYYVCSKINNFWRSLITIADIFIYLFICFCNFIYTLLKQQGLKINLLNTYLNYLFYILIIQYSLGMFSILKSGFGFVNPDFEFPKKKTRNPNNGFCLTEIFLRGGFH